ncbi:MAG: ADP-forming succinate--CoA ligase subunit beta [Candidatus Eutrophobiaceae bacterium]
MNLHEYQAKKLFAQYGLPVPLGKAAHSVKDALRHAHELGGDQWIVKAQVHAGGRGKAGGVKLIKSTEELEEFVGQLLSNRLVTKQSTPDGQPVNCVLVQSVAAIEAELYLGMLVDRQKARIAIMVSSAGGMDIEEVAATTPEKIHTVHVNPVTGLMDHQCRQLGFALDLDKEQRRQLGVIMHGLYRLFTEYDLSLVEINPLTISASGALEILDAKISIDDNALFRQSMLEEWRDPSQEDQRESDAKKWNLSYVALEGNIGCMVNGAGLAMATMDIIKLHGGDPANFLDVGGGATAERVAEAFKLITRDDQVRAILVNIFGGIVRCDLIAEGIIQAVSEVGVRLPVIVRLEGTNVAEGKQLLANSGLDLTAVNSLSAAAQKAVELAKKGT